MKRRPDVFPVHCLFGFKSLAGSRKHFLVFGFRFFAFGETCTCQRFHGCLGVDHAFAGAVRQGKRLVCGAVEQAGDASPAARQDLQGFVGNDLIRRGADNAKLVNQVICRFMQAERLQANADRQPLIERSQHAKFQRFQNTRQRQQHDLNRFAALPFEVAQQAQLLKQVGGQMLRFVDHQDSAFCGFIVLEQEVR